MKIAALLPQKTVRRLWDWTATQIYDQFRVPGNERNKTKHEREATQNARSHNMEHARREITHLSNQKLHLPMSPEPRMA